MALPLDAVLRDQPLLGPGRDVRRRACYQPDPLRLSHDPHCGRRARRAGRGGAFPRGGRSGYTLTYALGLALVYASLGLLAGLTGSLFGAISSNPWSYFAVGNLLLLFGLAMLDAIPVSVPGRILAWASRFGGRLLRGRVCHGGDLGAGGGPLRRARLCGGADLCDGHPERCPRVSCTCSSSLWG